MVAWLTSLFNKGGAKAPQQPMGRSTKQDFTSVMQTVVEETILATAYWLIRFVNKTLETRAIAQKSSPTTQVEEKIHQEDPVGKAEDDVNLAHHTKVNLEELLVKILSVGTSIEQLHDRNQEMLALESRISALETSLEKESLEQVKNDIAKQFTIDIEERFASAEKLVEQAGDFFLEKLISAVENTTRLENRVANLEKGLSQYSAIVKVLEQQDRTIRGLQYRLARIESSHTEDSRTFYKSPAEVR